MGALSFFFNRTAALTPARFPHGSFTVDGTGRVVVSTLPQSFPAARMTEISSLMLSTLRSARELGMPLNELTVRFAGLQIRARSLAGGAIIFLTPQEF